MDFAQDTTTGRTARLRDVHLHDRFGTLLALLVAMFVISGFSEFRWARVITGVLQIAALFVAYFSTRRAMSLPIVLVASAMAAAAIGITFLVESVDRAEHGVAAMLVAMVFAVLLVAVSRRVIAQPQVDLETLFGAMCVYLLIGMLFTDVYLAVDAFALDPIFGRTVSHEDYSYFSFVTLTTLGYGDVVAVSEVVRRFAVVEAMIGQIFLATVVARLVSLYGMQRRPGES